MTSPCGILTFKIMVEEKEPFEFIVRLISWRRTQVSFLMLTQCLYMNKELGVFQKFYFKHICIQKKELFKAQCLYMDKGIISKVWVWAYQSSITVKQGCQTHFHWEPHQPLSCLQRAEWNFRTGNYVTTP